MMMVRSELRASPIEGIGVFAAEHIPAGAIVWQLDERFYSIIRKDDLPSLPPVIREHFQRYSWPHMTRPGLLLCDIDNGRFMNHSDKANTYFGDPERARATVDIKPGQEITCNYKEFDPDFSGF